MKSFNNPQLQLAYDFVQYTDQHIFLTGKAGTGKTTFLLNLKGKLNKRMIVVAPTGVAAINAGGVTIHSFFQLAFGPFIPVDASARTQAEKSQDAYNQAITNKFSREKINIIKSLDLLIIDEISMVRADVLDAIDEVLRRFKDRYKPFGGVQLLMIGDLQQLPPVVKSDEWELLRDHYNTMFFFGSKALQKTSYIPIELKHIYRQSDDAFIEILNKVRDNKIDAETLIELNKRYIPNFASDSDDGYITLTSHIKQSQQINETKLEKLPGKTHQFEATISGEFPENSFPADKELALKVGAQVMFIKNDISHEKQFYNGKIGTIVDFEDDRIMVKCPDNDYPISVEPLEWSNNKYSIDAETKEIKETIMGTFTQFPLKLAWAITIHKSQGLTFEKAIIDANAAFAHGQVYVALSRCKTLDGVILNTPISLSSIKTDHTVLTFTHEAEQNQPDEKALEASKHAFQQKLHAELFDYTSLDRRLQFVIKNLSEHKGSLLDSFRETFYKMDDALKKDLLKVSVSFGKEIHNLVAQQSNIEENTEIQERTKKGCVYFLEKTNAIVVNVLQTTPLETDNKEVRKSMNDALDKLQTEAIIKISCLKACLNGFSVMTYLNARAIAAIEKPEVKKEQKVYVDFNSDIIPHPKLYAMLKAWRNEKAKDNGVPGFMIMHQKALMQLVLVQPDTKKELEKVKWIGKIMANKMGDEILAVIKKYKERYAGAEPEGIYEKLPSHTSGLVKDLLKPEADLPKKVVKTKKEKINSKVFTFGLFKNGHTIEEIAKEREMTVSTIEGHLAQYVGSGELCIDQVVPKEKMDIISNYYLNNPDSGMAAAKEALGDAITYGEIRFVLKYFEFQKELKLQQP
jgi:uncharacterized protein YpbB/nucleoside-triphosphatase THEP1